MIKSLFNLFLIFILCFTALGMPLNLDLSKFSNLPDFPFDFSVADENVSYKTDIDSFSSENPTQINFQIQMQNAEIRSANPSDFSFLLDVIKNDGTRSTLDVSTLIQALPPVKISSDVSHIKNFSLNLSQKKLNLPDGTYTFKLYSTSNALEDAKPLKFDVTYFTLSTYIPAINEMAHGMMPLTLYFPDPSYYEYLVPITRFVNYNRIPLSTIVKNLREGSVSLGVASPIPNVTKLRIKKDMVLVYISKDLEKYNENPKNATFALNSFVQSLTTIPNIDKVKFFVNGKESDTLFNTYDTKTLFSKNTDVKVYLGLDANEKRLLLVPQNMAIVSEDTLIEDMITALKTAKVTGRNFENVIAPIPENITLINFSRQEDTLTLNFSKELLYAYNDRLDLQRMMLDSLLFSFTSIAGIKEIQILVEDQMTDSFGGVDLSQAQTCPKFINPEKE
ncbi:GerMN domain-containing protein [Marinisporobacter balticus]|uniref:Sporulation and spore germination protein n=1 Tax=Marinisporobacter balticus TaxID=2018667 RepID=A0A4R2K9V6_9FIRM|nr:GerMN domain-containing protein [Marinisporobacter balticus]TCO68767.1 sporulation and spore germination protein [Marinisporobacter balticus]